MSRPATKKNLVKQMLYIDPDSTYDELKSLTGLTVSFIRQIKRELGLTDAKYSARISDRDFLEAYAICKDDQGKRNGKSIRAAARIIGVSNVALTNRIRDYEDDQNSKPKAAEWLRKAWV